MKTIFKTSLFLIIYVISGCDEDIPKVTKLQTGQMSKITYNSATASGEFIDVSGNVTEYGHCWNTTGNPTISDSKYPVSGTAKKGEFFSDLSGLTGNTDYFVRAYAFDNGETLYGNVTTFKTTLTPELSIISPVSTDHWVGATSVTIQWQDNFDDNILIYLIKENTVVDEIKGLPGIPSDGSYEFTLNSNFIYAHDYKIRIIKADNPNLIWESQAFTISEQSGSEKDINDIPAVKIGTQWWMRNNLERYVLTDGTPLQSGTDYYYYNDSIKYKYDYGLLYASHVLSQICPSGWHVPTNDDWDILINELGGMSNAGGHLKEPSTTTNLWLDPYSCDGSSKFNALPGGHRYNGSYYGIRKSACFWSSTSVQSGGTILDPIYRRYYYSVDNQSNEIYQTGLDNSGKFCCSYYLGISIRCVLD